MGPVTVCLATSATLTLPRQISRGRGGAAADPPTGAAGGSRRGGVDRRGDVLEGHGEHVVEHECHLLPDPVLNRIPRVTLTTIFS
jgi:hypothetical protein